MDYNREDFLEAALDASIETNKKLLELIKLYRKDILTLDDMDNVKHLEES